MVYLPKGRSFSAQFVSAVRVPPRSPLVRGTDDRNASSPPLEARQRELCATAQDPSPGVAASVYRWSSACRLLAGFGSPFAKWGTCLGSQVDDAARTASRKWYTIPTRQNNAPGRPWSCLPTSVRTDAPVHPNAAVAAATEPASGTGFALGGIGLATLASVPASAETPAGHAKLRHWVRRNNVRSPVWHATLQRALGVGLWLCWLL